jgi:hypothetical protein
MLFMVIEHYSATKKNAIANRFYEQGRLLPEGVVYQASWLDEAGTLCFQLMEAPSRELLDQWIARWSDLVDFEVVSVLTLAEFWERRNGHPKS